MKRLVIVLLLASVSSVVCSDIIPPVVPGQSLYSISTEIVDGINLLGSGVSVIEGDLQNISGSNLEQIASYYEIIAHNASQAEVITTALVNDLSQLESVLDDLATISSQIASIEADLNQVGSTTNVISSDLDTLDSKIEVIQSLTDQLSFDISSMDQFISQIPGIATLLNSTYDTVTQIDSTLDALTSAVDSLSTSSSSCNITLLTSSIDLLISAVDAISTSSSSCNISQLASIIESQIEQLKVVPDFVQTPTIFTSYSIQANTSRYFSQRTQTSVTAGTDAYVMTLYNSGVHDRVVRISGIALSSFSNGAVSELRLSMYKDGTITAPTFTPITGSDIEIDTTGSIASLGTQVFDVYGASGGSPAYPKSLLKFIPKEVYSVIIAPGEVVIITDTSTTNHTLLCTVMWEEIIN